MTKNKAALVIGLNYDTETKLKGLSKLDAAIDCAEDVAAWLEPEFDVSLITDAEGEVTVQRIKCELKKFQGGPGENTFYQYSMLLIYFAGHGIEQNYADYWVLNLASYDAEEAINLKQACDRASRSGFPVVVMVSDACRQDENLPRALRELNGSHLFYNKDPDQRRATQVDEMRAARVGKAAWEQKPDGERGFSIFSRALMQATTDPDEAHVTVIEARGQKIRCVTNRTLSHILQSEVDEVLRNLKKAGNLQTTQKQPIFISAPSGDNTYIRALLDLAENAAPAKEPAAAIAEETAAPEDDHGLSEAAPFDFEEAMEESAAPDDDGGLWDDLFDDNASAGAGAGAGAEGDGAAIPEPFTPDLALEPDFALEPLGALEPPEVTEPPQVTELRGIGKKTKMVFEQVGIRSVADLAYINTEAMTKLEALNPRSAMKARNDKWQYRARELMESAGLRLPVSRIAAASLNLDRSEDLPESAGLQSADVQGDLGALVPDVERKSCEAGCGLLWSGAEVVRAEVLPLGSGKSELVGDAGGGIGHTVWLWDVEGTASCLVEFRDGRSTIVPVIRGFISYGTLDSVGIQSFGMFPNDAPLDDVAAGRAEDPILRDLLDLRGLLTMTLRDRSFGTLSPDAIDDLHSRIAAFWDVDPSLAILAAALLMEAGMGREIPTRLADAPHAAALFDIALLSRGDHQERVPEGARTPCPALTVNWNYIGSRDAALPNSLKPMKRHLLGSLWTCFDRAPTLKANDIFPVGDRS